jgi:hypothetical protein
LLAACVALMIGAYSIGLHQGGGDDAVLPAVVPADRDDRGRAAEPAGGVPEAKRKAKAPAPVEEAEPATVEAESPPAGATPPPVGEGRVAADEVRQAQTDDADRHVQEQPEQLVAREEQVAPTAPRQAREARDARVLASKQSSDRAQAETSTLTDEAQLPVFMLNGFPVVVEAPDSVRVAQDDCGRVLLIYTSDGTIRIRLAGER